MKNRSQPIGRQLSLESGRDLWHATPYTKMALHSLQGAAIVLLNKPMMMEHKQPWTIKLWHSVCWFNSNLLRLTYLSWSLFCSRVMESSSCALRADCFAASSLSLSYSFIYIRDTTNDSCSHGPAAHRAPPPQETVREIMAGRVVWRVKFKRLTIDGKEHYEINICG